MVCEAALSGGAPRLVSLGGKHWDAGGPSWELLVRRLLAIGLGKGFEMVETKPKEQLRLADLAFGTVERVVRHKLFMLEQREEASAIASADERAANTEKLKRGAELCLAAAGQRLFADVTVILYENWRASGSIHRALAETRLGPVDRRGYGWSSLITYNFDDLMGEPPDQRGIPRAAGPCLGQRWSAIPAPPQSGALMDHSGSLPRTLLTMDRTE